MTTPGCFDEADRSVSFCVVASRFFLSALFNFFALPFFFCSGSIAIVVRNHDFDERRVMREFIKPLLPARRKFIACDEAAPHAFGQRHAQRQRGRSLLHSARDEERVRLRQKLRHALLNEEMRERIGAARAFRVGRSARELVESVCEMLLKERERAARGTSSALCDFGKHRRGFDKLCGAREAKRTGAARVTCEHSGDWQITTRVLHFGDERGGLFP